MIKNLKDTAINVATFIFYSVINVVFVLPLVIVIMLLNKYTK